MKINDIKYLSVAELNAKLKELNSELFNLRSLTLLGHLQIQWHFTM